MLAACTLALAGAVPAHAGGSNLQFERDHYEPGERAVATGGFGPGCCDRGWLEDGPYYAWLVPSDETQQAEATLPNDVIPIGEVHLSQEPYQVNGQTYFRNIATVEFDVPDVPPGRYWVAHCNDPCTKELGDITGGLLQVGAPPPPATTTAPPPTTTTPTTTTTHHDHARGTRGRCVTRDRTGDGLEDPDRGPGGGRRGRGRGGHRGRRAALAPPPGAVTAVT